MKPEMKFYLFALLFLTVSICSYSQTVPAVTHAVCAYCGADIQAGQHHKKGCPYYSSSNSSSSSSSGISLENSVKMQLASSLAGAFFGILFNENSKSNQQAIEQQQQQQQAVMLAQRAAEEKRINDSIVQIKFEKMMQSYKRLNDANNIQYKSITTSSLQFKSLDSGGAAMTMEEKERQNFKKRGIGITWDYTAWAQVPANSYKMEEPPYVPETSGADKYLYDAINKIETFEGGRVAAMAGRYMVGIKNNTMSYLKDVSEAAVSGDMMKMKEVGEMDLRKLSSNALYETGVKTIKANYENMKDKLTEGVKSKNFEIINAKAKNIFPNYKLVSEQLPKDLNEVALDVIF